MSFFSSSLHISPIVCVILAFSAMNMGCDKKGDTEQVQTKGWSTQKLEQKLEADHFKVQDDSNQRAFSQLHWDLQWQHPLARLDEPRTHSFKVSKGNVSVYVFAGFYDSEQEAMEAMTAVTKGKNELEAKRLNLGAVRDQNAVFVAIPWDPLPLVTGDTSHVKMAMTVLEKLAGKPPEINPMPRIEQEIAAKKSGGDDLKPDMGPR